MARYAVDLIIGGHDVADVSFLNDITEGVKEDFAQRPLGDVGGGDVVTALGFPVAGHVLKGGEDFAFVPLVVVSLEAEDGLETDLGGEVGVFTEGFLDAAPAGIAGDVDDGRQDDVAAAAGRLAGGGGVQLPRQFAVEAGGDADGLPPGRGVERGQAVQALLVEDGGDAEAGFLDEPALDVVAEFDLVDDGSAGVRWSAQLAGARDVADAVGDEDGGGIGVPAGLPGVHPFFILPDGGDLGDFLLQRHAADEVFDAVVDRSGGVAVEGVGRGLFGGGGGDAGRRVGFLLPAPVEGGEEGKAKANDEVAHVSVVSIKEFRPNLHCSSFIPCTRGRAPFQTIDWRL